MPPVFIARVKGDEKAIEAPTQAKLEVEVIARIAIWKGVYAGTAAGSTVYLAAAVLLILSTALIFIPTTVIAVVVLIAYHNYMAHAYNPFAHRRFAKRRMRDWEIELARIQNLDSRLPYKKLPTEP